METHKTILLLAANPLAPDPRKTVHLRLHEEEREIKEILIRAGYPKMPIRSAVAARPRDIQQALLDFEPQIVHFSGHGAGSKGLLFESATGQEQFVRSEALAELFEIFAEYVECVVLNACYSEIQAQAISQHIDYVIGMDQTVGDKAAIEFSVGFYRALGAGRSYEIAYKLGRNAIAMESLSGSTAPILIRKPRLTEPSVSVEQQPIPLPSNPLLDERELDGKPRRSLPKPTPLPEPHPPVKVPSNDEGEAASQLINHLFDALGSPNIETAIQQFQAIAHQSLFPDGQMNLSFRNDRFSHAFEKIRSYKRPNSNVVGQLTKRTRIGSGANREYGEERSYPIDRIDNLGGLRGDICIFFTNNSREAKISNLSFN